MSALSEPHRSRASRAEDASATQASASPSEEHLDALPVLAEEATLLRTRRPGAIVPRSSPSLAIPIVQAAAAAAGGFVAGAAVVGFVHRHQQRATPAKPRRRARGVRRSGRGGRTTARAGELVQIVGSRSLLVDVHLLGER